jgi:hypothetical protein
LSFFKCWQLSAIRRTVFPLKPCWKENVSFTLTKTGHFVALITRHYTYNCIKLMPNKEVFYTHFLFCLVIFTKTQAIYVSCNTEVHLCNRCLQNKINNYCMYQKRVCLAFSNQNPANEPKYFLWPIQIISSMVQF